MGTTSVTFTNNMCWNSNPQLLRGFTDSKVWGSSHSCLGTTVPTFFLLLSTLPALLIYLFSEAFPSSCLLQANPSMSQSLKCSPSSGCFCRNRSSNWKYELFISPTKGIWGHLRKPDKYMIWLRKLKVVCITHQREKMHQLNGAEVERRPFCLSTTGENSLTLQLSIRPCSSLWIRCLIGCLALRKGFYKWQPWLFIIIHPVLFNSGHMRAVMGKLTCSSLDSR